MTLNTNDAVLDSINTEANANTNVTPPVATTSDNNPPAAPPVTLSDDSLVEVIVNGQPVQKTWKEAKSGIMFQSDYTRKTQELAAQRAEFDSRVRQVQERETEAQSRLLALDRALGRVAPEEPKLEPDGIVTVEQLERVLAQREAKTKEEYERKLQETSTLAERNRVFSQWERDVNDKIEQLTTAHPLLKTIPHLGAILRQEAKGSNPTNEQEMFSAIVEAGKRINASLESAYDERSKQAAINKGRLTTKGPVAPGGHFAPPPAQSFMKGRSIDWNKIGNAVAALPEDD